jgi:hypothetical protein
VSFVRREWSQALDFSRGDKKYVPCLNPLALAIGFPRVSVSPFPRVLFKVHFLKSFSFFAPNLEINSSWS